MDSLTHKKCVPCEGGVLPMEKEEIEKYLSVVSGWSVGEKPEIVKNFSFEDFAQALKFINAVGEIAESEGHHPDILLHNWNQVELRLSTHAIGGIHLNDFVLAAKIDEMRGQKFRTQTT